MLSMKKQIILYVIFLLPMIAAADAVVIDGIYYNLISKSKIAEVTRNPSKYRAVINIPDSVTHEGVVYTVKSIGQSAFSNCTNLISVTIPNSVTSIERFAFSNCCVLSSITIPNSVASFGDYAFNGCTGLTSITIPNSVTSIGNSAFYGCTGLTSITIPNSVTSIGNSLFYGCTGLTSITIPNSVTSIGDSAFYGCTSLASVSIPNSVTSIGSSAFQFCAGLTYVVIPNSVTDIGNSVFADCIHLISVTIQNGVTSIGNSAFSYCTNLSSVSISNGVTSIGNSAFSYCTSLSSIIIPNSVTSIGNGAFSNCTGLSSVSIPNSVKSIGGYAFSCCTGLTSIIIPNSVTSIGNGAFSGCPELTDVYCYAKKVPTTQSDAFEGSYIEYATLHVPATSLSAYCTTEPWSGFGIVAAIGSGENLETIEIASARDLVNFASRVNAGETLLCGILKADIDLSEINGSWIPIGNESFPFNGIFDGQGHTITSFEHTATGDCNGLFGVINYATVKNFDISGTLTSQKDWNGVVGRADGESIVSGIHSSLTINVSDCVAHTGGLVGGSTQRSAHIIIVENCEYSGTLTHSGVGDCQAGILGYTNGGGVKNCIFSGTIIGENSNYGGILGYCKNVGFIGVQNCLSVGKIVTDTSCTTAAAIIGNWNGNITANVKNNYYCLQEGSTTIIATGNKASNCEAPHAVTPEQLASGEICYALNGDQTKINWYQTLGADAHPVLNKEHNIVLYDSSTGIYSNQDEDGISTIKANRTTDGIYNLFGQQTPILQKGVNIIHMKDGTVRKFFIK